MEKTISINDELYQCFQIAAESSGLDEDSLLNNLISQYTLSVLSKVLKGTAAQKKKTDVKEEKFRPENVTRKCDNPQEKKSPADVQRELFMDWFQTQTHDGKAYGKASIRQYASHIKSACKNPIFDKIPTNNLFEITSYKEFSAIQKRIKKCAGYAEFERKSARGFTSAMQKYGEFLQSQEKK